MNKRFEVGSGFEDITKEEALDPGDEFDARDETAETVRTKVPDVADKLQSVWGHGPKTGRQLSR